MRTFIYKKVNASQSIRLYVDEVFDLYKVYPDGHEALIECRQDLEEAIKNDIPICIEVGYVKTSYDKDMIILNESGEKI